jgi:hypothetical protein
MLFLAFIFFFYFEKDVCAVEFQKRWLPHTHLIWLDAEFKCRNIKDMDYIVSSEIPNKNDDPICYDIVSKFMMYKPCGLINQKFKCMKKNKCSKSFLKPFKTATTYDDNGFVCYKRCHQHDNFILKDEIQLYNDYIFHIIESYYWDTMHTSMLRYVVNQIKYLFKYVSKGLDRCRMLVEKENNDKIKAYLHSCFIYLYEVV